MPQRPGRPRTNFEERILQEMSASEKQAEEIIAKKINSNTPSIMAFEAACLLLEIEAGAAPAAIQRRPIFKKLISSRRRTARTVNGVLATFCNSFSKHMRRSGTTGKMRGKVKLRIGTTSEKTSESRRRLLRISVFL